MIWKVVLFLVSFAANVFVLTLPGVMLFFLGIVDSAFELAFIGFVSLILGVTNIICAVFMLASDKRSQAVAIKVGHTACAGVVAFGVFVSFSISSGFPFVFYVAIAAITAAANLSAKPKEKPAGLCESCGYDLAGLPTDICPECGNRLSDDRAGAAAGAM